MPNSQESEVVVLGACILHNCYESTSEILRAEMFYNTYNQSIYQTMSEMHANMMGIDLITLKERLTQKGILDHVGGILYLMKLTNNVSGVVQLRSHCEIVKEKYIKREVIRIGHELVKKGYEDTDVLDIIGDAENGIYSLSQSYFKNEYHHISDVIPDMISNVAAAEMKESDVTGVDIGYYEMNRIIAGWQKTDFVIVAARASVGKTGFALNLARNAVISRSAKTNVGFFSLEMSSVQLVQRLTAMDGKIQLNSIKSGKNLNKVTFTDTTQRMCNYGIYIDDSAGMNIFELRSKVKRMVTKNGVGLVIIDYLQLMSGIKDRNSNREQEISSISRELKKLAKELSITIVALSQLNRDLEKRQNKRPMLADLRESGAIEQDADIVILLSRPPKEDREKDPILKRMGFVDIAKHRNGELCYLQFDAIDEYQLWQERGVVGNVSTINDDIPF